MSGDTIEPCWRDQAECRPLVGSAEDARQTRQARPSEPVGRRRKDSVAPHQLPDGGLVQAVNRAPVIDVTPAPPSLAGVRSVSFELSVQGAGFALARTFAGDNERAAFKKAILAANEGGHWIDLQIGTAPSLIQVCRHLWKALARPRRALSTDSLHGAIRCLEADRCGWRVQPQHLALKPTYLPRKV